MLGQSSLYYYTSGLQLAIQFACLSQLQKFFLLQNSSPCKGGQKKMKSQRTDEGGKEYSFTYGSEERNGLHLKKTKIERNTLR